MKLRTIFTLVLIGAALTTVTAQKEKHFEVGFQGGYGTHWIINQNNYGFQEMDYEYSWGGGWNIQAGYNFTGKLGIFTEVGMLNQGQDYSDQTILGQPADVQRSIKTKYLNVPLFFKYSAGVNKTYFRMLVGPQFCFLQSAEQTYTIDGVSMEGQIELENKEGVPFDPAASDIKDRFNSLDVAFVIDLGVDIFVMEDILYLSAGARMFYGFTDINASAYQMENYDGNYEASHNAGGTIYAGIHYIIMGGK